MGLLGLINQFPLYYAGAQFGISAAMVLAAFCASAILRERSEALRMAFAFMIIGLVASAINFALLQVYGLFGDWLGTAHLAVVVLAIAAACRLVWNASNWSPPFARAKAEIAVALVFLLGFYWEDVQERYAALFYQGEIEEQKYAAIDPEILWTAQPLLLAKAVKPFLQPVRTDAKVFIVSAAPGGSQQLFGREAKAVLGELEARFVGRSRSILLSNAKVDLYRTPLASRSNLEGAIEALGNNYDSNRDLAIIFLTSHGNREAELSTGLPDFTQLKPISADFLARALHQAGIHRRIVIVSACYSGSWIKPLASPDTIIITASAAERTSFGCDDTRDFTLFGQAFVDSPLDRGASLRDAFEDLKRRVARAERASAASPSRPQAYVGERMEGLWDGSEGESGARLKPDR